MSEELDPYAGDPLRWGHSMAHLAPLMLPCLDCVGARRVVEVGAYAGALTRLLLHWAQEADAQVVAIDPMPQPPLVELAQEHPRLELVRRSSLEALPELAPADAVVIDGDHNYHTVLSELRALASRAGEDLPLLLFHDVCWPHGRRDDYYAPEAIPPEYRHPTVGEGQGIFPGEAGLRPDGLPYPRSAAHEGGPRNGVLTALEDFVAEQGGMTHAVVPAFFGFGAAWRVDAPWAAGIEALLRPWDRHPLLTALEANRVLAIAQGHATLHRTWEEQTLRARQEALLRRLLDSSAFRAAEWLSRLRVRAGVASEVGAVSREEIRRVLAFSRGR